VNNDESGDLALLAHEPLLEALGNAFGDVLLASPFVSSSAAGPLREVAKTSSASWRLLTALRPESVASGFLNLEAIRWLMDAGVKVRSSTELHAKVALCDSVFGMVGSANLTGRGLGLAEASNLELSVLLSAAQCATAREVFETWWAGAAEVSKAALRDVEAKARALPRPRSPQSKTRQGAVGDVAETLLLQSRDRGLWVKAVYGEGGDLFAGDGWISSGGGRPSFAVGDLVLIYSRSAGACNAVVEIRTEARHDPRFVELKGGYVPKDADRWPWVNNIRGRLVIPEGRTATPADIGFRAQGLQNGKKRIDLSQFAVAMRLAADRTAER
jgi:hypothetical protein